MYYTRELAPSWIACGEVKVLKKVKIQKNSEDGGESSLNILLEEVLVANAVNETIVISDKMDKIPES